MTRPTTRPLIIFAALSVASICAHAEPAPADSPEKAKARALLKEGVRLLDAGQLAPALRKFEEAYAAFPSAKILVNIGTAQSGLGRATDAANTYQRYLDSGNDDPVQRPAVTAALAELDATLGRLAVKLRGTASATGEVRIASGPWQPLSPSGLVRVAPGRFDLRARAAAGAREVPVSGTVAAREQRDVIVDLAAHDPARGAAVLPPDSSSRVAQGATSRIPATAPDPSSRVAQGATSRIPAPAPDPSSRVAQGSTSRIPAPAPDPSSRVAQGSTSRALPSSAVPSSAVPSSAVPSSAVPSSALPSSSVPSSAVPSSALPSSALASSALSSSASPSSAVPSPAEAIEQRASGEPRVHASRWTPLRQGAVVAGAVSVISVAGMTVLALRARSMWNESRPDMNRELARQAATRANLATGAGVVGVAALGAGVVLWFVGAPSSPERRSVTAFVSATHAGLAVTGGF